MSRCSDAPWRNIYSCSVPGIQIKSKDLKVSLWGYQKHLLNLRNQKEIKGVGNKRQEIWLN